MKSGKGLFFGWWVVCAAAVGLATGGFAAILAIDVVSTAWTSEFGWTSGQVRMAFGLGIAASVLTAPVIGRLVDRFGARRIVLPCVAGLAVLLIAACGLTPNALTLFPASLAVAVIGGGVSPASLVRPVVLWFERRRGVALGLALAGLAAALVIVPALTGALVAAAGWRWACAAHGLVLLLVTLPATAALLRDTPSGQGLAPDGAPLSEPQRAALSGARPPPGYAIELIRQQGHFWSLLLASLFAACGIAGVLSVSADVAAVGQSAPSRPAVGAALLAGLLLGGWLVDRWPAPRIAIALGLCAAATAYTLAIASTGPSVLPGVLGMAFVAGAYLTLIAYLVSRCFGLRSFGAAYGWQTAALAAGFAVAPPIAAAGSALTGSRTGVLILCGSLLLAAAGLLSRIPPYPNWSFGPGFRVNPGASARDG